jgi:hypothetical protein
VHAGELLLGCGAGLASCSSVASADTSIGSPTTSATVLNGFGICVRSQLFAVQCDEASR